jgi:small subunit ribosomal protein S15
MPTPSEKQNIVKEYQIREGDTGSVEIQIALLTKKITELINHLKFYPKDNSSRRGLLKMVGKRKKMLDYLSRTSHKSYSALVRKLGLKK